MSRRFRALSFGVALALGAFLTACSDQPAAAPDDTASPEISLYTTPCSTADINALIDVIFQKPLLAAAFKVKVNLYIKLSQNGPKPAARAKLYALIDDLLKLSDTVSDPTRLRKIEALIRLLYCILGDTAPPLDLVNGDAAVVTPTTGATVAARCQTNCETGANDAATKVDPGAVPVSVPSAVVSIVPISSPDPLDTPLRQRGPFYEFTVTPSLTFANPVLVGVCLNKNNDESDDRVRLAHNLSPSLPVMEGNIRFGNIEIISPAASIADLNLACSDPLAPPVGPIGRALEWLLPAKLYAGGTGTSGRGGLVKNYSPFGGVVPDTLTYGSSNWLFVQPSTGNSTAPSAYTGLDGVTPIGPWAFGGAPFGNVRDGSGSFASFCDGTNGQINYASVTIATQWLRAVDLSVPPNGISSGEYTYLFARTVFFTRQSGSLDLPIDNDIQVWLDGVDVTSTLQYGESPQFADGFLIHDYCATKNQVTLPLSNITTGVHVLAVKARDRGVASFLDAQFNPDD